MNHVCSVCLQDASEVGRLMLFHTSHSRTSPLVWLCKSCRDARKKSTEPKLFTARQAALLLPLQTGSSIHISFTVHAARLRSETFEAYLCKF